MARGNEVVCDHVSYLKAYMGEKDPTDEVSLTQKVKEVASSIEDL